MKKQRLLLALILLVGAMSLSAHAKESIFFGMDSKSEIMGYHQITNTSMENSIFSAEASDEDPYFSLPVSYTGGDYPVIYMRMRSKVNPRNDGNALRAQIFYKGIAADGSAINYSGSNSVQASIVDYSDDGYRLYAFDFSAKANYQDATITMLRIDPINSTGSFDIDYILLTEKDADLFYTFDLDMGIFTTSNCQNVHISEGALHGTTAKSNAVIYTENLRYFGGDYPHVYARVRFPELAANGSSLLFTNLLDENGTEVKAWSAKFAGDPDKCVRMPLKSPANNEYQTLCYSYEKFPGYLSHDVSKVYYNVTSTANSAFDIDYLRFACANEDYRFDFDAEGYAEGLTLSSPKMEVSDGALRFTCGESYENPYAMLNCDALIADNYTRLEALVAYPSTATVEAPVVRLYYAGTDAEGNAFSLSEAYAVNAIPLITCGGAYLLYTADLTKAAKWAGSTISTLRFDFLKGNTVDFAVDYLRLVGSETKSGVYDENLLSLSCDFEDKTTDRACGTYKIDFGGQNIAYAKSVVLYWQSGNETDGYSDLADYTPITTLTGKDAEKGYVIQKDILIPAGATAVAAYVTDSEKTCKLLCEIPAGKQISDYGTPITRIALLTDNHFGYSNVNAIRDHHLAALNEIEAFGADFVIDAGDFTQWYGTIEKDYQWTLAEDYFGRFTMPVFITNGNHDVPSEGIINSPIYGEAAGFTFDTTENGGYYERFLASWLERNEEAGNYTVNRAEGVNWYDLEYDGYHIIMLAVPRWENGVQTTSIGEEQLKWLDNRLYVDEQSGKPIFVTAHVALENTVGINKPYYTDGEDLRAVLNKHPEVVFISGHSHMNLDSDHTLALNGGSMSPSYVHAGGANDIVNYSGNDLSTKTQVTNIAQGVIADIYADRILIRGRDFSGHKWISRGLYEITLGKAPTVDNLSATRKDNTVTASARGAESYAWYQNGKLLSESENCTVSNENMPIALRAYDKNGGYTSVLFDSLCAIAEDGDACIQTLSSYTSLRLNDKTGVRTVAYINDIHRSACTEYGFITARSTPEIEENGNLLVLNAERTPTGTNQYGIRYVTGVGYDTVNHIDRLYATDGSVFGESSLGDGYYASAVIAGIPEENYNTDFVIRPYIIIDGKVFYGKVVTVNLYISAKNVREDTEVYDALSQSQKEYIDNIITKVENN